MLTRSSVPWKECAKKCKSKNIFFYKNLRILRLVSFIYRLIFKGTTVCHRKINYRSFYSTTKHTNTKIEDAHRDQCDPLKHICKPRIVVILCEGLLFNANNF